MAAHLCQRASSQRVEGRHEKMASVVYYKYSGFAELFAGSTAQTVELASQIRVITLLKRLLDSKHNVRVF
jgi:hypothetical protein